MVSVSRLAGPPQTGQVVLTNSLHLAIGEEPLPVISTFSGSLTGRFSGFSATMPHLSQLIIGIGVPQ
ncbi:MAG: hypothetical protein BWY87_00936 [Deltaproteobacteria bacterium ADurb.Bin510]|nr:MAG: hypothetical protein BWY87_00936 [Deltaproteobacteria bacterium ADurb.Bin510]